MRRIVILAVLCSAAWTAAAQSTLNFGIPQRQTQDEWPKTKAPAPVVERKAKVAQPAVLTPAPDGEFILSGGWEMASGDAVVSKPFLDPAFDTSDWYNATVPGTVLTTLVQQGVYPDPYYGLNNLLIPDSLSRTDWWYRLKFDAPDAAAGKNVRLLFNGINYRAKIWLNGKLLGSMTGAFKRGTFDVTTVLKAKGNVLAVHILPPDNPGIGHEETAESFGPNGGALCLDGPTFIASEGWDWMPAIRDRDMGIWQDVRLCTDNGIVIGDAQVITDLPLPDTTSAKITVKIPLTNTTKNRTTVKLSGTAEGISFSQEATLDAGESRVLTAEALLDKPRLWWPNGYGEQNLYTLVLKLDDGTQKSIRFGVREMSYELAVDAPGKQGLRMEYSPTNVTQKGKILFDFKKLRDANVPNKNTVVPSLMPGVDMANFTEIEQNGSPYIAIRVNGRPIFCRGGDWGMDDAMKDCSRQKLEPAFKLHQLANFNMIRNWTGECTEEVFFDLCDEYGILVWNDFWMSTGEYNLLPLDWDLFFANVTDVVRRFRNHPSLAVWCPRNEGYAEGLETGLQEIILNEDGTRHYHGNSRGLNMPGSGPWGYHDNPETFFTRIAHGFNSEFGSNSMPPYRVFKKFIAKEDEWPIGDVWYYHDYHVKGWSGWDAFERDMARLSKKPVESAEEYCRRGQILNYNGHKMMLEAYNHKMWSDVTGMLYWITQPAWPSLICQAYSWDYDTFGSFYGMMKGCEPVHIQRNITDGHVIVANATLHSYPGVRATMEVVTPQGKRLFRWEGKADLGANDKTDFGVVALPKGYTGNVLVRLVLKDAKGGILSENDYWYGQSYSNAPEGLCDMAATTVKVTSKRLSATSVEVTVRNTGKTAAILVAARIADAATGESILPAYASDNYFNLLPGEGRTLKIEYPASKAELAIEAEGVNCFEKTALQ